MRRKFPISNFQFPTPGFTLIETMVAMGIFVILIGVIASIFLIGLRSQRDQIDLLLVNDNVSLALEQMAREIRTGDNFCIPGSQLCFVDPQGVSSGSELHFQNANKTQVVYRLDPSNEAIERSYDGGSNFVPITSANARVTRLNFTRVEKGFADDQSWPPRILIVLEVGSKKANLQGILTNIQTTVSARNI